MISTYSIGHIDADPDPTRYKMTGTFTPTDSGIYELEVFNYRNDNMNGSLYNFIDNINLAPEIPDFETTAHSVSISDAISVDMLIKPGPAWANSPYLVLAAFSSYPGFVIDGIQVHINMDNLFFYSLQNVNSPVFENSQGFTDSAGEAVFTFNTSGPTPALYGTVITFEYFMLWSSGYPRPIQYASHPVRLNFVP